MKDLGLLAWLTQLGVSVAVPIGVFSFLGIYLHNKFHIGKWIVIVAVLIGVICGIRGFIYSVKTLDQIANKKKDNDVPKVSFNEHE